MRAEECTCGDEYGHCARFQMGEHLMPYNRPSRTETGVSS